MKKYTKYTKYPSYPPAPPPPPPQFQIPDEDDEEEELPMMTFSDRASAVEATLQTNALSEIFVERDDKITALEDQMRIMKLMTEMATTTKALQSEVQNQRLENDTGKKEGPVKKWNWKGGTGEAKEYDEWRDREGNRERDRHLADFGEKVIRLAMDTCLIASHE